MKIKDWIDKEGYHIKFGKGCQGKWFRFCVEIQSSEGSEFVISVKTGVLCINNRQLERL